MIRDLARVRQMVSGWGWSIVGSVTLSALCAWTEGLALVALTRLITALALGAAPEPLLGLQLGLTAYLGITLVALGTRLCLQVAASTYRAWLEIAFQSVLRRRMYRAWLEATWSRQAILAEGELHHSVVRLGMDSMRGIRMVFATLDAAIAITVLLVWAASEEPAVTGFLLVWLVVMLAVMGPVGGVGRRLGQRTAAAQQHYAERLSEVLQLSEEVRAFAVHDKVGPWVSEADETLRGLRWQTLALQQIVPAGYVAGVLLGVLGGAGGLMMAGFPALASVAAVVLVFRAARYGQRVGRQLHTIREMLPFWETWRDRVEHLEANAEPTGTVELKAFSGLVLDQVGFAYEDGGRALSGISATLRCGEIVGLVGPSGGGKSTLVQLLLGLRSPTEGAIQVVAPGGGDGTAVSEIRRADWADLVGFVPQEPALADATVRENVAFFRNVSDTELNRAAQDAALAADLERLPDGWDTPVGPRGGELSGGQRQRVAIARALVGSPQLLVLDEPTSALDPGSEEAIAHMLESMGERCLVVVIAHRPRTLEVCDRVLRLDGGRLVEALGAGA